MTFQRSSTPSDPLRTSAPYPCFIITLTNFSPLVERTRHYQRPYQNWSQAQQQQQPRAMLIPGVLVHLGGSSTDEHEHLLYNTVRFQLQQIVGSYLRLTRRPCPINLVFDLSDMRPHF